MTLQRSQAVLCAACALLFVSLGPVAVEATCGEQLLSQNFNKYTTPVKYDNPYDDFPAVYQLKDPNCVAGDGVLTATFPKGMILGEDTGCSFFSGISPSLDEATMQYDLYFQPGFQWTLGGKLPGFCGGECPRGCDHLSPGWSARLMWRKDGHLVTYVYWPEMGQYDVTCGVDWEWDITIETGVWYSIATYVKMNTPGQKNGVAKGWVNGKEVFSKSDIMWMVAGDSPDKKINAAYITTYVGGSTYEFAPTQTQYLKFDNIAAWTGQGPCSPAPAPEPAPAPAPAPAPKPAPTPAPAPAPMPVPETEPSSPPPPKPVSPPPVVLSPPPLVELSPPPVVSSPPPPRSGGLGRAGADPVASPPPPPACPCKNGNVNPDLPLDTSAPRVIGQYVLYRGEAGWDIQDVTGDQVQEVTVVSGSLHDRVARCAAWCNINSECDNFTLHVNKCTLRKDFGAVPQRINEDPEVNGYYFLYFTADDPFAASLPDPSAQSTPCVCDESPSPPVEPATPSPSLPSDDTELLFTAPQTIGKYSLYNKEADWDIINVVGDQLAVYYVGGSLFQRIGKCANYCNQNVECANFTLHVKVCTIRKDIGANPLKIPRDGRAKRFLYTQG